MIYIITVGANQGYHQVKIYKLQREKLAFLFSNYKGYTFKVMPFGPTKPPIIYNCMMGRLRIEWHALFLETVRKRKVIGSRTVRVNYADEIYLNGTKNFSGSKVIIDYILTWSTNLELILIYFECVCKVF